MNMAEFDRICARGAAIIGPDPTWASTFRDYLNPFSTKNRLGLTNEEFQKLTEYATIIDNRRAAWDNASKILDQQEDSGSSVEMWMAIIEKADEHWLYMTTWNELAGPIFNLISQITKEGGKDKYVSWAHQHGPSSKDTYFTESELSAAKQKSAFGLDMVQGLDKINRDRAEKVEAERQERLRRRALIKKKRTIKTDEEIDTMIRENQRKLREEMRKHENRDSTDHADYALIGELRWLLAWHRDWRIHPEDIGFKYTHGVRCPRPQDFENPDSQYYKTEAPFRERVHIDSDLRQAYHDLGIRFYMYAETLKVFMMDDIEEKSWHGEDIQKIYAENAKKYLHRRTRRSFATGKHKKN